MQVHAQPSSQRTLKRVSGKIEDTQVSAPAFGKVTEDSAMFDAKKTWQTLVKGSSNLLHRANNHQASMKAIWLRFFSWTEGNYKRNSQCVTNSTNKIELSTI